MDSKEDDGSVGSKKRSRCVEVVLFEDPSKKSREKRGRRIPNKESKFTKTTGAIRGKKGRTETESDQTDFKSMFQDVKDLGVTGFNKKERKKIEQETAQSLGAWKPKGQKMPYPTLQTVVKKRKIREKERIEMEKAMGIYIKKKQERKEKKPSASGWWVNQTIKIDRPNNNVKLKSSDLKAIKRKIAG